MAPDVVAIFPNVVILLRPGSSSSRRRNFFNKLLHNQTAFLAQKKARVFGHPMIVMPIRRPRVTLTAGLNRAGGFCHNGSGKENGVFQNNENGGRAMAIMRKAGWFGGGGG